MKKQTPKKPKKRNPPDATLRNISALKKRVAELNKRVEDLEDHAEWTRLSDRNVGLCLMKIGARLDRIEDGDEPNPELRPPLINEPVKFVDTFKKGEK